MSVVHLTMRKGLHQLAVGTGTVYERGGRYFIVTAWHNLTGRNSYSLRPLSKESAVPDNVVAIVPLTVDSHAGPGGVRMPFTLPIETEMDTHFLVHPKGWPRIDVAVIPIDPDAPLLQEMRVSTGDEHRRQGRMRMPVGAGGVSTDVQPIQLCEGAYGTCGEKPQDLLDLGGDLFIMGYPRGVSDFFASPIWKRATVASDPHIGWNREAKFLVDCASREGMSGAPVVSYSSSGRVLAAGITHHGPPRAALLHGIYVGRISDPETPKEDRLFEAQIGTVWKREVIDDIIDAKTPALHSSQIPAAEREVEQAVQDLWVVDADYATKVVERAEYRSGMAQKVLEYLNGNADPAVVLQLVKAHAEELLARGTDAQNIHNEP